MPTFKQSNNCFLSWDGLDISANVSGHSFSRDGDTIDNTTYGKTSKVYDPGLKDATLSIDCKWSAGAAGFDEKMDGTLGSKLTLIYREDSAVASASNPQYTGTAILKHFERTGEVGGYITATAEFQFSDTITRATS